MPILDVATSLYYVRDRADYLSLAVAFRAGYEPQPPWVEQEPGELDRLLIARGLDLLNTALIDPDLDVDDWPAFIRRRECWRASPSARSGLSSSPTPHTKARSGQVTGSGRFSGRRAGSRRVNIREARAMRAATSSPVFSACSWASS